MKRYFYLLAFCFCMMMSLSGQEEIVVTQGEKPQPIRLTGQDAAFVAGNNDFALKFFKTVNDEDESGESFIYSPMGITFVLCMVNAAAEGATQQELEQVLGFNGADKQAVNEYCKTLIEKLPQVDKPVQLQIANAVFLNDKYKLKKQYQEDIIQYYNALAESADFTSKKTADRINDWCNDKTEGMIPEIIKSIDSSMVTYLLNAIFFKAEWLYDFDEALTKERDFKTADGKIKLPMMFQSSNSFKYIHDTIFAAIDLPYENGLWSMTVMLPDEGKTTDDVINYLAENGLDFFRKSRKCEAFLYLPRFETKSSTKNLIGTLRKLGLNHIFENTAKIPNMCDKNLYVDFMLQKARVEVNEKGTKAAAVTVVGLHETTSARVQPKAVEFRADRPFVYVIREASSGVILFVGKFTGK